jgi:hypothetical protein
MITACILVIKLDSILDGVWSHEVVIQTKRGSIEITY